MNSFAERLLENDLAEILGGKRPPDLTQQALTRLAGGHATPAEDKPLAPIVKPVFRRHPVLRLLEAACIVLALGGITWLLWPGNRNTDLPSGVKAAPGAVYAVSGVAIRLDKGWLYVAPGTPAVVVGDDRVDRIEAHAVIKAGPLSPQEALDSSRQESLRDLSDKEKDMLSNPKRWLAIGGVSICLFSGSVTVNGQVVPYNPNVKVEQRGDPAIEEAATDDPKAVETPARKSEFAVLRDYTGDASDITEPEYHDIRNKTDLETVLSRHLSKGYDKPPITVDFETEMVIAVFLGKSTNTPAVSASGAFKAEDRYVLRVTATPYQTIGRGKTTSPFGFFVLPKTECNIALEFGEVWEMHGRPAWKQLRVFTTYAGAVPGIRAGEGGALKTHTGTGSGMCKPKDLEDPHSLGRSYATYTDKMAYDLFWAEHKPGTTKPWDVDFEKYNVIFALHNRTRCSTGFVLDETLVSADTRVLRIRNEVDFKHVDDDSKVTTTWIMFLVPKDGRTTIIEEKEIFLRVPQELIPEYDPDDHGPRKPIYEKRGSDHPVYWDEIATLKP